MACFDNSATYAILQMEAVVRKIIIVFMLIAMPLLYAAPVFPGYDITFFRTITDSLMVNDDKRFGIDYTGYGFIGEEMRTGIYLRIGIQAPYSSLSAIFDDEDEEETESGEQPSDSIKTMLETSFSLSLSIGPSFRYLVGEDILWYMGTGFLTSIRYNNVEQKGSSVSTDVEMDIGFDLDMGFRINIAKNTTLRIGIHSIAPLFILQVETMNFKYGNVNSYTTDARIIPNIFLPPDKRERFETEGYISLGHTYRSKSKNTEYRYRVSDKSIEIIQ